MGLGLGLFGLGIGFTVYGLGLCIACGLVVYSCLRLHVLQYLLNMKEACFSHAHVLGKHVPDFQFGRLQSVKAALNLKGERAKKPAPA